MAHLEKYKAQYRWRAVEDTERRAMKWDKEEGTIKINYNFFKKGEQNHEASGWRDGERAREKGRLSKLGPCHAQCVGRGQAWEQVLTLSLKMLSWGPVRLPSSRWIYVGPEPGRVYWAWERFGDSFLCHSKAREKWRGPLQERVWSERKKDRSLEAPNVLNL